MLPLTPAVRLPAKLWMVAVNIEVLGAPMARQAAAAQVLLAAGGFGLTPHQEVLEGVVDMSAAAASTVQWAA